MHDLNADIAVGYLLIISALIVLLIGVINHARSDD